MNTTLDRTIGTLIVVLAVLVLYAVLSHLLAPPPLPSGTSLPRQGQPLPHYQAAAMHEQQALHGILLAQDASAVAAQAKAAAAIPKPSPSPSAAPDPPPADPPPADPPPATVYTAAQIGQIWLAAGGSAAAEGTAECIAEAESGGNTDAISPTNDVGLWQIDVAHAGQNGIPATWDAFVAYEEVPANNAAEAILLSGNGTSWAAWTTQYDCV